MDYRIMIPNRISIWLRAGGPIFPTSDMQPFSIQHAVLKIPQKAWTPRYETEQPGAWVAEITGIPVLRPGLDVTRSETLIHPSSALEPTVNRVVCPMHSDATLSNS
jgi:hypothetical protein